jgi:hypothetical protein
MSNDDLKAELERLRNENAAIKKGASTSIRMKVSEKGALSIYGMGRFPVTLYKEQWLKLLDMSDDIRAFIAANEGQLKKGLSGAQEFRSLRPHPSFLGSRGHSRPCHPNPCTGPAPALSAVHPARSAQRVRVSIATQSAFPLSNAVPRKERRYRCVDVGDSSRRISNFSFLMLFQSRERAAMSAAGKGLSLSPAGGFA